MIDILVYLFENHYDFSTDPDSDALALKLKAVGFEKEDVSDALRWLGGLKSACMARFPSERRSLRIYTADEQRSLGVACQGFILFLESANLITPALRELVIERALTLGDFPMPLEKFKIIVLMVLWSRGPDLDPLIVEELLYAADPELQH